MPKKEISNKVERTTLAIGLMLEEFEILEVLGQGSFEITYKARDTHLDVIVVIKEYMPNQFALHTETFEWGMQKFLDEAKVLKEFEHTAIVKVLKLFKANDTAYFVMDFYEGETLGDYLDNHRHKKFAQDEILSVMMPIIEGLKAVHAEGFLHRYIVPDNIFLRIIRPPILINFGASRNALGVKSENISAIIKHGYSAPEQYFSNLQQDPSTDVYAISAVIYKMITGVRVVESTHRQSDLFNDNNDPIENIVLKYQDKFDKSFLETIQKGLSLKQKDRIQTIAEFQSALVHKEDVSLLEIPKDTNSSGNTIYLFIIMLLLVVLGYLLLSEETKPREDTKREQNSSLYIVSKWIIPTDKSCKANGGEIEEGICKSNWDKAQKICSANNGRLATIDELKEVIKLCGGINIEYSDVGFSTSYKNIANKPYQACYKKEGFAYIHNFWSSSTYADNDTHAWFVDFAFGYANFDDRNYPYSVRCLPIGE